MGLRPIRPSSRLADNGKRFDSAERFNFVVLQVCMGGGFGGKVVRDRVVFAWCRGLGILPFIGLQRLGMLMAVFLRSSVFFVVFLGIPEGVFLATVFRS